MCRGGRLTVFGVSLLCACGSSGVPEISCEDLLRETSSSFESSLQSGPYCVHGRADVVDGTVTICSGTIRLDVVGFQSERELLIEAALRPDTERLKVWASTNTVGARYTAVLNVDGTGASCDRP